MMKIVEARRMRGKAHANGGISKAKITIFLEKEGDMIYEKDAIHNYSCLVMALALAGCGSNTSSQGADGTSTDVLKVSVAAQNNSGQVFQYMAEARNFLEEEGVEVEMVYINNGTDAFQALTAGKVDVLSTYGTGGPLIQIANGQDFTIFGGYMIIGETPCFGKPETEWTSLESFRGKKIGITRFGTPDVVLKGILYDAGFLDEVTFIEYKKTGSIAGGGCRRS